jgi:hypothetical protein
MSTNISLHYASDKDSNLFYQMFDENKKKFYNTDNY